MSKIVKLIEKLKRKPSDFSYSELSKLLSNFGYEEDTKGKSSGSRVAWINFHSKHIIRLHKPHPGNILKNYQIDIVIDELKKEGLI